MKYLLTALAALCILVIIGMGHVSYANDLVTNRQLNLPANLNVAATGTLLAATQTPQSDGTIVHTVRKGETIDSIAAAYGVSVQQIRDYNNIPSGGVSLGQRLLISIAYPTKLPANATFVIVTSTNTPNPSLVHFVIVTATYTPNASELATTVVPPTATALANVTATPGATATAPPPPVPSLPTASPLPSPTLYSIASKGSVCVTGFKDSNSNHWFDNGEGRLPGMKISLAQTSGTAQGTQELTTTADGISCFNDLPSGAFTVTAAAPDGFGLTTAAKLAVDLTAGAQLSLSFGAAPGYQAQAAPTSSGTVVSAITSTPITSIGILNTVARNVGLIVLAIAGAILIGGLGVIVLARRL